jgi:hypothetical protein
MMSFKRAGPSSAARRAEFSIDRQLPTVRAIGRPNFAAGVITRRSQAVEMARPEPIAKPSTSAIVGFLTASSRSSTSSIRAS